MVYMEAIRKREENIKQLYNELDNLQTIKNDLQDKAKLILKEKVKVNVEFNKYTNLVNQSENKAPKINKERERLFEELKKLEIARQEFKKQLKDVEEKIKGIEKTIITSKTEIQMLEQEMINQFENPNNDYQDYDFAPLNSENKSDKIQEHQSEYDFDM